MLLEQKAGLSTRQEFSHAAKAHTEKPDRVPITSSAGSSGTRAENTQSLKNQTNNVNCSEHVNRREN
jgi:hypothetical protein